MKQKKIVNFLYVALLIMALFGLLLNEMYAAIDRVTPPTGGTVHSGFKTRRNEVWNTTKLILQVTAIGVFIYTGIKYMYSSAEQKADLKKGLVMTFTGTALVFALTYVADFIKAIAGQLFQ